MADITRIVETIYKVVDKATKPLASMASAAGGAANALTSIINPLTALAGGFISMAGAKHLIDINSQAETLQLTIAGTLRAFDAVGESSASITKRFAAGTKEWGDAQHAAFLDARHSATEVLDQINKDAAALPGSAEEYAEVYRTALPAALAAGMTDVSKIASFTNDFAATAIANQIDAQQAARDMSQIINGQAGMMKKSWTVIQPLIGKTAEEFNKLSAPERIKEMQGALLKYKPLLNEFGNTWDAIYGTTTALVTQITRNASNPFFEAVKSVFNDINVWLDKNKDAITEALAGGFKTAVEWGMKLVDVVKKIDFGHIAKSMGGVGGIGKMMGVMGGVKALAGGGIGGIASMALGGMAASGGGMEGMLSKISPVLEKLGEMFGKIVEIAYPFIEQLSKGVFILVQALMPAFEGVADVLGELMQEVGPMIPEIAESIGKILKDLTPSFIGLLEAAVKLTPVLLTLVDWTLKLGEALASLIDWVFSVLPDSLVPEGYKSKKADESASAQTALTDMVTKAQAMNAPPVVYDPAPGPLAGAWENMFSEANIAASLTATSDSLVALKVAADAVNVTEKQYADALIATSGGLSTFSGFLSAIPTEADMVKMIADMKAHPDATAAKKPKVPSNRGGSKTVQDFRYSRFDIMQKFAEGFDPDRVANAFASDLEAISDKKLSSGVAPLFSLR